jgi:formate hydrogenlyase subunit 3/multisubunit Na+/H+ antiporter MnhD subunit
MNSLPVWPVIIPLSGALLAVVWPKRSAWIGMFATLMTLLASGLLLWQVARQGQQIHALGGWDPGLGIALRADPLAAALLLMSSLVALAAGWYATGYFADAARQSRFWPIWLLLITALHALFLSADLFNLYVTLELLGLSAVALAALGAGRAAIEASLRYLTIGLLGSMAFLAGVTLVYIRYGTLDMLSLAQLIQSEPATWLALGLMSAGLMVKSALFPLHFWLPPAHANAPAPVSAALSALVVKAAVYLMLRLWLDLFQPAVTPAAAWPLGLLGAAAVLWGSWNALRAERLKLLAAYSTVAQLGYLFIFFPLLMALPAGQQRDAAFGALVLMALTHAFAKSALFLAAGTIQQHAGHDRIADLGGTARLLPMTTFTLALAGTALIGLPPSGAFLAKWQLLSTAIALGQWIWVPVVASGSLLAAAYSFRLLGYTFGPGDRVALARVDRRESLPALLLAIVATAVLGLGAAMVWQFVAPGALLMEAPL